MITWNIGNRKLEFDDATHTYFVDGAKCISVTQLLKFKFPSKYDGVSKEVLNKAADKGTELHEAIEVYEEYGLERNDLQEFRNYLFLKNKFNFKVKQVEIPIIIQHGDLTVCGRLDQVQELDEKTGLADIKRTSVLDKEYLAYQLNLYRIGYTQCYGEVISFLKGIHLHNDKRKYIDLPVNTDIAIELLEEYERKLEDESR